MKLLPFSWRYPRNRPVRLDSSALSEVVYHPRLRELDVTFRNGSQYQYGCVEPETYRQLLQAESAGRFFVKHIRNDHPMRRLVAQD